MTELVLAHLRALPWIADDAVLQPIGGDHSNINWSLHSGDQRYFVKRYVHADARFVDPHGTYRLQQQLAQQGLAIPPLYYDASLTLQIDRWQNAETVADLKVPITEKLAALARVMVKIHSSGIAAKPLDLVSRWQHYLGLMGSSGRAYYAQADALAQQWQVSTEHCLCHNDLSFHHVAADLSFCFDWEYAAVGCRYFDLASSAHALALDASEVAYFVESYAQFAGIDVCVVQQNVAAMTPLVELTNLLWSATRSLDVKNH